MKRPDPASKPNKATVIARPPVNVSAPNVAPSSDPYSVGDNKGKPRKPKGGKKLTKADIGLPTDFRFVSCCINYFY